MIKPTNIKDIKLDFVIDYCQAMNEVEWLKELMNTPVKPDKNGKERKISFIEVRKEFCLKFFPDIAPKAKPKKPSMYERIAAL